MEIRTVTTLTAKRDEIIRMIESYETKLDQARADLSHINAVLVIFNTNPDQMLDYKPYTETARLFRYGELSNLCRDILAGGKLTTGEITKAVMERKGFDTQDGVLHKALSYRVCHLLSAMVKRRKVTSVPYHRLNGRAPTRLWELIPSEQL